MKTLRQSFACALAVAVMLTLSAKSANAALTSVFDYTFNNNQAPPGFTAVGSPTYSGGQLILNGSSALKASTPVTATDNFGMEIIVTPTVLNGFDFYLSNNGAASNSGFGILHEANYEALLQGSGLTMASGVAPVVSTEVRLALVRAGGLYTFYVNNTASATGGNINPTAVPATLVIGGNIITAPSTLEGLANAKINEVRLFTFAAGQFNAATDLLTAPTAIPEPASATLLIFGGIFMWLRNGRRCGRATSR